MSDKKKFTIITAARSEMIKMEKIWMENDKLSCKTMTDISFLPEPIFSFIVMLAAVARLVVVKAAQ